MDDATREALLGSIEKWERIVAGTGKIKGRSIAHYAHVPRLIRKVIAWDAPVERAGESTGGITPYIGYLR